MQSKTPESIIGTGSYNDLWVSYDCLREEFKDELDIEFSESMYCIDAPDYLPAGSVYSYHNRALVMTFYKRQS